MAYGRKIRRSIERKVYGRAFLGANPKGRTTKGGKGRVADLAGRNLAILEDHRLPLIPARRGENRGVNVGGSDLKPLRFADGRLRNRIAPKIWKRGESRGK